MLKEDPLLWLQPLSSKDMKTDVLALIHFIHCEQLDIIEQTAP